MEESLLEKFNRANHGIASHDSYAASVMRERPESGRTRGCTRWQLLGAFAVVIVVVVLLQRQKLIILCRSFVSDKDDDEDPLFQKLSRGERK